MNTRRHPRTLNEAFGPYTSHYIVSKPEPRWTPVGVALTLAYVCAIALMAYLLFTQQ